MVEVDFVLVRFRCAGIRDDFQDGIGISLAVYFSGCSLKCKGCQNPELQDPTSGKIRDTVEVIEILDELSDFYESVVFLGGDPLEQPNALLNILKSCSIPTVLYTGRLYSEIPKDIRELCSVVVDGPYIEGLKTGKFPASSNQRVYCEDPALLQRFMINKI